MSGTETLSAPLGGKLARALLPRLGKKELRALGSMGSAELIAANRWFGCYAMAVHGVLEANGGSSGGGTKLFAQERQQAAATSYRLARQAIGERANNRLIAVLQDGLSIVKLAERLGENRQIVTGMLKADLQRLVEYYTKANTLH